MKTKYLFCAAAGEITQDTVFVDVYVGTSRQDQRDLATISHLASLHTFFFQKWSDSVSEFMRKIRLSLNDGEDSHRHDPASLAMTVQELRRRLLGGSFDEFCRVFVQASRNLQRLNYCSNSIYQCAMHRASQVPCNAAHVKNLSNQTTAL